MGRSGPPRECWCCGRTEPHHGRGLCRRCHKRWQGRGFTGPGPGPEFRSAAQYAREYAHTITSLPARDAAAELGVTPRTITRWRAALREAVPQ